jgi:hypothetical protein
LVYLFDISMFFNGGSKMNKKGFIIPSIIAVIIVVSVVALWSNTDNEYGWAVSKIVSPINRTLPKLSLSGSVSPSSVSLLTRQAQAFTVTVSASGGSGAYRYSYFNADGFGGVNQTVGTQLCTAGTYSCTRNLYWSNAGSYVVRTRVRVTDRSGAYVEQIFNSSVVVKAANQTCTLEGGIVNSAGCCSGLTKIYALTTTVGCDTLIAGNPGYCTKCGDGVCKSPENICSCPADCAQTPKCTGSNSTLLTRFSNSSCTDSSGSFSSYCLNNSVVLFGCNSGLGKCVNVAYDCTPYNTTCSGGYCSMCKTGYRWVNSSSPVKGCVPNVIGCNVVPPGCVCMGNNMVACP